jgi:YesN/AraC family two-component response regulator
VALGVVSLVFTSLLFMLRYAGHNQNFSVADMVKDDLVPALEEEECMECEGECMRSEEESAESEGERMRSEEESVECEVECMGSEVDSKGSKEEEKVKVKTGVKTPEAVNVWAKRNVPIREQIEKLRTEIERVMEEEKLYLIHDFRLTDLIERMKTNREYVYRAVNVGMGMSFSQMVNRKRIEYAVELLKQQPDKDITELYHETGFTSQAVFYRNFKSYTGKSPKAFVQDIDVNLL